MNGLYLVAAFVGVASAVDCSNARPWRAELYPDSETLVHFDQKLYSNLYYAIETMLPTLGEPWTLLGDCDQGTAGEYFVKCDGLHQWVPKIYAESSMVVFENYAWHNIWYANEDEQPSVAPNWIRDGYCSENGATPSQQPPTVLPTVASTPARVLTSGAPLVTSQPPVVTSHRPVVTSPGPTTPQAVTSKSVVPPVLPTTRVPVVPPTGPLGAFPNPVYAPFVDVCLGSQPDYAQLYQQTAQKHFMFSFIVADTGVCSASWAGVYTLAQGPYANFEADIAKIRAWGGDIGVSFGGQINTELADAPACQVGDAVGNIKKAYLSVIDKFDLKHVDFDIETNAISEAHRTTGWVYRFEAVKQIQAERPELTVSWTLPVLPDGLLSNGVAFVEDLLKSGVRLDWINVMTMDYGSYYSGGKTMHQCEVQALEALASQVFSTAQRLGLASEYGWTSSTDVFPYLGSTPMIGVNDVNTEVYSLQDAASSLAQWKTRNLRFWSSWSLSRDAPCSGGWAQPICSSGDVQKSKFEFASVMSKYTSA